MPKPYAEDNIFVKKTYDRQASFYDILYGFITGFGRRHTVKAINKRSGKVLDVGVGTGLSLPYYMKHLDIYGIDISSKMLQVARQRVAAQELHHIKELREMSADTIEYPDNHFDTVVAMYVMTVVPDSDKVMTELKRVCKPGGEIILVNHFSNQVGVRSWLERLVMPISTRIGWQSVFPIEKVLHHKELGLISQHKIKPGNIFTMLHFKKI